MEEGQLSIFDQGYYEQKTEELDLNKLGFKIHASLIYKLGNELISNEIIAISELVKNAYDADSKYVKLIVNPTYSIYDSNRNINKNYWKNRDKRCWLRNGNR